MANRLFSFQPIALLCLASQVVLAPGAEAAEPKLPAAVAAEIKGAADICREVGGKPNTKAAVKLADLNGDGKIDYVVDVGSINCDGAASIYGDREKAVVVLVGDGKGGARNAFSDNVFGASIETKGAIAKLWLTVSGRQCGKKPARDFASENFCDRALQWNGKTAKFDYAPVTSIRMIQ
jgi:hypothetical protein